MGEYFLFVAKDTVLKTPAGGGGAGSGSGGGGAAGGGSGGSGDAEGKKGGDTAKGVDTVETPKLRAFQKKVQLGQTVGPNVVIKSGINIGDRIIVDGVQAIHEGSRINAAPAKQPDGQDSTGHKADSSIHK
jgi:multidrug efflux pump subunit AcrA (membrane-fusion protein)